MGSDAESTPKLSLYSLPISRPLEMQSPPLPPRQTLASIPFEWEEAPGKPRPTATPPAKSRSLELPPRLLSESPSVKMTNMPSPMTVLEGPYVGRSGFRTSSFSSSPKTGSFRSTGAAEDDHQEGLRYWKREMGRMFSSRRWRSLNRGESDFHFNLTSSVFGGFEKMGDSKAVRRIRSLFSFSDATSNLLIMKKIHRFFERSSVSNSPDEGGSSTSANRPSSARRSSTDRRNQPENEGALPTQRASPSSPFVNYKKVVDDEKHISRMKRTTEGSLFYIRSTWHTASRLYNKRLAVNPEVKMLLDNTELCTLFNRQMPKSDRTVVEACCRRWWDTTHTFHLPTCELGFTPLDFTMLTGISIGGNKIPLPEVNEDSTDQKEKLATYFPFFLDELEFGAIKGSVISEFLGSDNIIEAIGAETVARLYLFYILGYVFFPNGNNSCPIFWINYVIDLENVWRYDWGSAILARMYSGLDVASRRSIKSLNFFWQPIEFFFYEYMATQCPQLVFAAPQTWPRIHRWSLENVETAKNSVRFNLEVADQQLEMRSMQSIIWQPYSNDIALQFPIQQISFNLSRCRYLLVDPQIGGNWYLGERCYRQIFGRIAIPNDPPVKMSKIPRDIFCHYNQIGWEPCTVYLSEATKELYEEYWAYVSGGPSLPPIGRRVNIDVVGYAALVGRDVEMSCTPHEVVGGVYNTQGGSSSSQPLAPDWSYTICSSNGETLQLPLPRDRPSLEPPAAMMQSRGIWRNLYIDAMNCANQLKYQLFMHPAEMAQQLKEKDRQLLEKDAEIERLRQNSQSYSQWRSLDDN